MIYNEPFPGESPLTYEYFCIYRDTGPTRSLRSLANVSINGKTRSLRQIGTWSSAHAWVERVEAFDADIATAAAKKTHKKRVDCHAEFINTDLEIARKIQADFRKFLASEYKTLDDYLHWIEIYETVRAWMYAISIDSPKQNNITMSDLKQLLGA